MSKKSNKKRRIESETSEEGEEYFDHKKSNDTSSIWFHYQTCREKITERTARCNYCKKIVLNYNSNTSK